MAARSENERNKAVVDEFYKAGIQGHLTRFVQYLHPDFTWTAPNYLPWGGTHTGAPLFRDQVLSRLPDVFDFTRFSYDNVVAEDGHVVAVIRRPLDGPRRQGRLDLGRLFRASGPAREARHRARPRPPIVIAPRAYPTDVRHDRIHPPDRADTVRRG
jgi:ketosteroid isomerase-like protein